MEDVERPSGKTFKSEKCRPDFEGMIQREREKSVELQRLYDALKPMIIGNNSYGFNTNKLKDLMGSLHIRLLIAENSIKMLIDEQENYKE